MTLKEALKEQMKDEVFKKEYELLEPEYKLIKQQIDNKKFCHVAQSVNSGCVSIKSQTFASGI